MAISKERIEELRTLDKQAYGKDLTYAATSTAAPLRPTRSARRRTWATASSCDSGSVLAASLEKGHVAFHHAIRDEYEQSMKGNENQ